MHSKRKLSNNTFKLMRRMTFQFLALALCLTSLHAKDSNVEAVLNASISINVTNVPLVKVLNQIERKAKVSFTYSPQIISPRQKVNLAAENQFLSVVLDDLLTPIAVDYKVFNDRTIVLKRAPEVGAVEKTKGITVSGRVTDETGEGLIGASILVEETGSGSTTDLDGYYSVDAEIGNTLIVSYTGYNTIEVEVTGPEMNIVLSEGVTLESVTIIGSRGKARSDLESAVPIDAIQSEELLSTAQPDLGQSIHFVVPSFTAQKFGINDLAPLIDPAQLRGLGSDQTLLLVNGKRRHKVAFFNGNDGVGKGQLGNDINSIPSAAIERVEVLRDGAAAQYGSDAIAGVINMQLKQNREGGSVSIYTGSTNTSPKWDDITNQGTPGEDIYDERITDANTFNMSANFGLPWGKKDGFISTTVNFQNSEPSDRSGTYSHSSGWYTDAQLQEIFDQTGVTLTDEELQAQNGIDLDRAVLGTADVRNGGVFINAGREINDDLDIYAMGGFTVKRVIGGVFSRSPARTERAALNIFPDGYNPEVPSLLTDWQILSGIKGDIGSGWNLDFSLGYSGNDVQLFSRNTVNPSLDDDSPTRFYTGGLTATQTILNLDAVKNLSDNVTLALGSEYRRETYAQAAGQRESWFAGPGAAVGDDIGSSGREGFTPASTGSWDRNNLGIYAELEADVTEDFLISLAGRFEDYSDFGGDFSYKVAARYKLADEFALRGSVNRSFRAPALAQTHYSNFSQISFDGGGNSVVSPTLPVRDPRVATAFGIENLTPETSLDFALGATASLLDGDLSLSLDAYQINVDDRIFIAQVAAADFPAFATSGFDDINFFSNAINTSTRGLDFVANYKNYIKENNFFGLSVALNLNKTEIDELNTTSQLAPHISFERTDNGSDDFIYLTEGTPISKLIISPSYRTGWLSILARVSNFGEVTEPRLRFNADINEWDDNPPGGGEPQILSAKTLVDLSLTAHVNDQLSITASANNIFDVYPDLLREAQVRSEVIFSRRVNQFGTNGRFLSLTLNYNW